MIGDRVRHARTYHGWSQGRLADLVSISQPAISKIEKGGPAAPDTLTAIARETQFTRAFFERGRLPDLPQGTLRFRKRATARLRDDERVRSHVRQTIEIIHDLEAELEGVAKPRAVRIRPVLPSASVDDDFIEALAVECREWIGVGRGDPIPNLTRAVERAGVAVIGSSHEIDKHEGATYWPDYPAGRPIICVSRGRPGDKTRISIAHELGHLLLHQLRDVQPEASEREAFLFAGALLLPRDVAYEIIQTPVILRELAIVKAGFGISIAALVKRCIDLGLIDQERRTSLEKQISARGWRKNEPVHVPDEEPQLVRQMIQFATGTTSPSQLHARFGLPPLAIRDLLG